MRDVLGSRASRVDVLPRSLEMEHAARAMARSALHDGVTLPAALFNLGRPLR